MEFQARSYAATEAGRCFTVEQTSDDTWSASLHDLEGGDVLDLGEHPSRVAAEVACRRYASATPGNVDLHVVEAEEGAEGPVQVHADEASPVESRALMRIATWLGENPDAAPSTTELCQIGGLSRFRRRAMRELAGFMQGSGYSYHRHAGRWHRTADAA